MFEIQYNDTEVLAALVKLQKATGNIVPALKEIGEVLTESTTSVFV